MSTRLALLIGNSRYTDRKLSHLSTPNADIDALASVLRDPKVGNFAHVFALRDQPIEFLRRNIAQFFTNRHRDDVVLLYFSGHGIRDDEGYLYLAAPDTQHDLLEATALPSAYITRLMDRTNSKRQVLILDCCYSGAFAWGTKNVQGASIGTAVAFEGNGYGRFVLTATDAMQYAWEGNRLFGEAPNSLFTQYLVKGLQTGEADIDHDGSITVNELYEFIYREMVANTKTQTPSKWSYKEQGEIVIAKSRFRGTRAATNIIDDDPQAVKERRHALILTPPHAEFLIQYPIPSLLRLSSRGLEQTFEIKPKNFRDNKAGNCGMTVIGIVEGEGDSASFITMGYLVWLFDAISNENTQVSLALEKAYASKEGLSKLKSRARTMSIQVKSQFYLETRNLLLQGTVLNLDFNFRHMWKTLLAELLHIERLKPIGPNGLAMRLRIWRKSNN